MMDEKVTSQSKKGNSAKTILMVNTYYGTIGGVERYLLQIAKLLAKQGWQVHGLFERQTPNTAGWEDTFDSVDFYSESSIDDVIKQYETIKLDYVFFHKVTDPQMVSKLQSKFTTLSLIHDHDYYCLRKHKYLPYKRINCPLPYTLVGCSLCSGLLCKKGAKLSFINLPRWHALLSKMRKCDATIVLSEHMRQNAIHNGWNPDKIHKLYPIVDLPDTPARTQTINFVPTVLYIGQLIRGKGVDLLLQALGKLSIKYNCVIVGSGNDAEYLKDLAMELHLDSNINWIGWSDDVNQYYTQADVLAVPSRWQEPFGLIGIEAFSHQLPVVAFDVGGVSEWLMHKVNGILVRHSDPAAFAKALEKLLSDPSLARQYGIAGYKMLKQKYSEDRFLSGWEQICQSCK
jgi:glycosyltransferase involved in cell wall biosynthesis